MTPIEGYEVLCDDCEGAGVVATAHAENWAMMRDVFHVEMDWDPEDQGWQEEDMCIECEGLGATLTPAGMRIMMLVAKRTQVAGN